MSTVLNKPFRCPALLLGLALAGSTLAVEPRPSAEGWSRWSVPLQSGVQAPCCWTLDRRGGVEQKGCALDDADGGTMIGGRAAESADGHLWVYVKREAGRIGAVRSFGSDCPIRADAPVLTLADVGAAESVAFLQAQADAAGRHIGDDILAAIAFHGDDTATAALVTASDAPQRKERREQALFWLGQARGEAGLQRVLEVAESEPSARLRKHALFVLSQSPLPAARTALRERTRSDADAEVRSQGLFWLAQADDPEALPLGLALLGDRAQSAGHDEAVFALSQLPAGKGEDVLITLVEGDFPREVKKQALFWLGQSGSDKALRFLDRLLADAGG